MSINNFKPFAFNYGANVSSQEDYENLAELLTGFQSGKASSAQINKALRQGTVMSSVLAQFICDITDVDVLDNGNDNIILENLKASIIKLTPGRFISAPIVITASSSYSPTRGTKNIIVEGVGGGCGGGGSATPPSGQYSVAGGGAGGTWARAMFPAPTGAVAVTIGSGGSPGAASATSTGAGEGGQGGDSSFGSLLICPGGKLSKASNSFPSNSITASEFTSHSLPPTVNGGILLGSLNGGASTPGLILGTYMISGKGGESYYSRGGISRYRSSSDLASGAQADNYGGGGGGACSGPGKSGLIGGAGSPGVFYIWEIS